MMHSISFGDGSLYPEGTEDHKEGQFMPTVGDTYANWFLIPSSRPTVSPPGTDAKFASLPGRDGDWDLSQWLRKDRPAYRNRSGSFEFYVENDHEFWMTIFPKVYNSLHGRKFKMVLEEDDPAYYYEGRFAVSDNRSEPYYSALKIDYNLQPWKRRCRKVLDETIWDTFNFEADYDYDPWHLESVSAGFAQNIWGDGYPFVPEVTLLSGGPVTVFFSDAAATYNADGTVTGELGKAKYGFNWLEVSGSGTVRIDWRGGSL